MEPAGVRLKKIRQESGISLEEVQKKTKIHLNLLKAIEGDSLTNLSPIYLKGFLKIYCKFLGVDPNEYIEDYKEPSYKVREGAKLKTVQVKQEKPAFKIPSLKFPSFRLSKRVINVFKFTIIIIIIWIILFNLGNFISSKRKAHPRGQIKSAKSAAVMPKSQTTEIMPQREALSGITLGIRAHENCWVSLKVDGKLVFQRVLQKGRFESWQAKNKIEFSLGNAGVVELEVNGQLFSNLGRKGQALKNILITKEGLKIGR